MSLREVLFSPPPSQPDAALPITAYSHGLILPTRTGTWIAILSDSDSSYTIPINGKYFKVIITGV